MQAWATYVEPILRLLLPVLIAVALLSIVCGALTAAATRKRFGEVLLFMAPFGWLGAISGLIAGASQEALVGALLTGS